MPINPVKGPDGSRRWQFEFSRRINGQRIRARKLLPASWSRTQADAFDRQESARLYAVATGTEKPQPFIGDALACYLDERAPHLKHGAGMARELALMFPYWNGRLLKHLAEVCAEYVEDHADDLAPGTLRNRLAYLKAACRWSWKHKGLGDTDPGARIVMPSVSNARWVSITRAQMLRLARACRHWETRALIRIAYYSGMRLGEITAATVADGCFVLPDSKNGEPVRIPVHPKIVRLLDYEWPTRFIIGYHFRAARDAAGLEGITFHTLRHSTATGLLEAKTDLHTVAAVLRHKSLASTKRYAHYQTHMIAEALGNLGKRGPKAA